MFRDRQDAGERLAERLAAEGLESPVVLALPRGGVPVAAPIAARLKAPLGLLLVRKIGVPGHEELAAGAVAEGAEPVFNPDVLAMIGKRPEAFAATVSEKRAEIAARRKAYLGDAPDPDLRGATVIVVDDGIATGATLRAALMALRARDPTRIILAIPVAPAEARGTFARLADRMICLAEPTFFSSVGEHYESFPQTSDSEVAQLLIGFRGRARPAD